MTTEIINAEVLEDSLTFASAVEDSKLYEAILKVKNKKSGIYCFTNLVNNKCYIGQAINLRARLRHHLNNFKHHRYDAPLYRAFSKYGVDSFKLHIITYVTIKEEKKLLDKLDELEIMYIKKYNSFAPNGYNLTVGGDRGIRGYKFTEEQLKKHSENVRKVLNDGRNKIYCYDINTELTTEYTSVTDLCTLLNVRIAHGNTRGILIHKKYIIGRSLLEITLKKLKLEERKDEYGRYKSNSGLFISKFTPEMKIDILNGITESEFVLKYNVCRKTFRKYRNKLIPEYKRVYKSRITLDKFIEVYKVFPSIKDCAEYFNDSRDYIYRLRKKAKLKGLL